MSLRGLGSVAIGSIAVPRMLQVINEAISQEYSGALVAGSVFAVGLHALYSWAYSTLRMRIMLGRFMKARMVGRIRPPHHIIERKALVEYLVQVLQSGPFYYSVVGPKGCGKSWVVQQAAAKVKGAVYMSLPANITEDDFVTLLARTIDFHFDEDVSLFKGLVRKIFSTFVEMQSRDGELSDLLRVTHAAEIVAKRAQKHLGYTPSLIIDNCGYLPPETLAKLHDWAYDSCCQGTLRVVFVMAQSPHFYHVVKRPATSRMELVHIPDVSRSEAVEYLEHAGVPEPYVSELVDKYTGGRVLELEKTCCRLRLRQACVASEEECARFEHIKQLALEGVCRHFRLRRLELIKPGTDEALNTQRYCFWSALLRTADQGCSISTDDFTECMANADVVEEVVKLFPFPFYRENGRIAIFPLVGTFVHARAGLPATEERREFLRRLDLLRRPDSADGGGTAA